MTSPDFDWSADADSVVVQSQPAIAVYRNPQGCVVIRQEGQFHPDEDHFVFVTPENAEVLAASVMALARELLSSPVPVPNTKGEAPRRLTHQQLLGRDGTGEQLASAAT